EVHQKKSFRACGACVFAFSASFRASTADAPNAKDREGLARRVAARFSLLSRAGNQSGWGRSIKKSPSAPAARAFLLFRIFPCKHGRCSKRKNPGLRRDFF